MLGGAEKEGQNGQLLLQSLVRGDMYIGGSSGIDGKAVVIDNLRGVLNRGTARVF